MAIHALPQEVSSRIAAGEVVENPTSVVKELLENSLDAGATEVSIEIRGGGVEYIRVSDNGHGIPADELEMAFQRFTTSKVSIVQDLEAISTLGFRGEALHSIAAVSSVSLVSRPAAQEFGARVEVANGELVGNAKQGASSGTSVSVRRLFRNFPARRKFLRSMATETSRLQTLVTRYALAYPEVRFRLTGEGSTVFSSNGAGELREVMAAIYGLNVAQSMLDLSPEEVPADGNGLSIWGMIGPPSLDRANRSYISFFVNRRWIQSRLLGYALEQAYRGFLKERRFPVSAVNIVVPREEVDVNVHPAKTEVRFRHQNQVFTALQQAVRVTLIAHSPVPEITRTQRMHSGPIVQPRTTAFWPTSPFGPTTEATLRGRQPLSASMVPRQPQHEAPVPKKALPALRVLGQVQNTYIVAEGPDGMYLVDQHAAHERVVFERVRAQVASRTSLSQSLLEPMTLEVDSRQQELLESRSGVISGLGFHIEAFGNRTYLLRAVPSLLRDGDPGQALLDVLDLMEEGGGLESWEERGAYSVACHGAIRAGKPLSQQEMSELARQLEQCRQPNTCPHGRPTIIHLSSSHLEREFGRR